MATPHAGFQAKRCSVTALGTQPPDAEMSATPWEQVYRNASGVRAAGKSQPWCDADPRLGETHGHKCSCIYEGFAGLWCDVQVPHVCPNQCNAKGLCRNGFCHCGEGWMGADCSVRAPALVEHSRSRQAHTPLVYVYNLPPKFNAHVRNPPSSLVGRGRWALAGLTTYRACGRRDRCCKHGSPRRCVCIAPTPQRATPIWRPKTPPASSCRTPLLPVGEFAPCMLRAPAHPPCIRLERRRLVVRTAPELARAEVFIRTQREVETEVFIRTQREVETRGAGCIRRYYSSELFIHEHLLRSPHRTLDPEQVRRSAHQCSIKIVTFRVWHGDRKGIER